MPTNQSTNCALCDAKYTDKNKQVTRNNVSFCTECADALPSLIKCPNDTCDFAPHHCTETLNGRKCPHELCDIPRCSKHTHEFHNKSLAKIEKTICCGCGEVVKMSEVKLFNIGDINEGYWCKNCEDADEDEEHEDECTCNACEDDYTNAGEKAMK